VKRIGLQLLGLAMLVAGVGFLAAIAVAGPTEAADWVGHDCSMSRAALGAEACNLLDLAEYAGEAIVVAVIGAVLVVVFRRPKTHFSSAELGGMS
jgi:hypothetical protein